MNFFVREERLFSYRADLLSDISLRVYMDPFDPFSSSKSS
jgi:hypothetical protein